MTATGLAKRTVCMIKELTPGEQADVNPLVSEGMILTGVNETDMRDRSKLGLCRQLYFYNCMRFSLATGARDGRGRGAGVHR